MNQNVFKWMAWRLLKINVDDPDKWNNSSLKAYYGWMWRFINWDNIRSQKASVVRNTPSKTISLNYHIFLIGWSLNFYKRSKMITSMTTFGRYHLFHSYKILISYLYYLCIISNSTEIPLSYLIMSRALCMHGWLSKVVTK